MDFSILMTWLIISQQRWKCKSFTSLWQQWSQNQHENDGDSVPASTWIALQCANNHSKWTKTTESVELRLVLSAMKGHTNAKVLIIYHYYETFAKDHSYINCIQKYFEGIYSLITTRIWNRFYYTTSEWMKKHFKLKKHILEFLVKNAFLTKKNHKFLEFLKTSNLSRGYLSYHKTKHFGDPYNQGKGKCRPTKPTHSDSCLANFWGTRVLTGVLKKNGKRESMKLW